MNQPPVVVGLGELLWDLFPDLRNPGGAPANFAFQAKLLGCDARVVSRVGIDNYGREIIQFIQDRGIDINAIQQDQDAPTGSVAVELDDAGHAQYTIEQNVAWDNIAMDETLTSTMQVADAVCFGTLAQRDERSRATIQAAVNMTSPECLRVFDINLRQQFYNRDVIEASFEIATILKLNDEEVRVVAPLLDLPTEEESFATAIRARFNLSIVVITRGARGCLLADENGTIEIAGTPVQVADTVGAGDAFTAGFVAALLHGLSPEQSARFANRVGGLVASHPGAMPTLDKEMSALTSKYFVK